MKNHLLTQGIVFKTSLFCLLLITMMSCKPDKSIELSFTFGPDDSGVIAEIINEFNRLNKGEILVNWKEAPRSSSDFFSQLMNSLEQGQGEIEIFGSDVIWTAHLAENNWAKDINDFFYENYKTDDFIEAAIQSAVYQNRVYGVPWFTDIGLLYYRKDLFEKTGLPHPPVTWDQIIRMSKKIQKETGIKHGMVFQGADYEGGTVNALEFIWNAGGNVLKGNFTVTSDFEDFERNPENITLDERRAIQGIGYARQLVDEGLTPDNISTFLEQETLESFVNGDAIFMRNWPGIYAVFTNPDSKIKADQVGIGALPISRPGGDSYSCLGGWNIMVNAKMDETKMPAAYEFIRYVTSVEQQKSRAIKGSNLPSLKNLYNDQEILDKNPIAKRLKYLINNARIRPVSPHYEDISKVIGGAFHKVLKGDIECEAALSEAQTVLTGLFEGYHK